MSTVSTQAVQPGSPPQAPQRSSAVRDFFGGTFQSLAVPILAIFTALVVGGLIIWVTTGDLLKVVGPEGAFAGLWEGAVGSPANIADTLLTSTPYMFAGLAVALAFKCGLFNIGAEGQLAVGAVCAAYVGYAFTGIPFPIHMFLALVAGLFGGLVWGAIPGFLKAYTGAHEVIVTIMLNYIALAIVQYLLGGPLKDHSPGNVSARTPLIQPSAEIPNLFVGTPWQIHYGVILAFVTSFLVYFFFKRTTWGFEIKTVGANQHAARYAGMSVAKNIVLAMALSGMLAGASGAVEVLGVTHRHELGFGSGYGFDSIAIALLGRTNPFGVVAAALLFGGLKSGATQMQFNTQISSSIISVVQGLVLLFVSADVIIRWLYHLKVRSTGMSLAPAVAAAISSTAIVVDESALPVGVDLTESYRDMAPATQENENAASSQVEEEENRLNGPPVSGGGG